MAQFRDTFLDSPVIRSIRLSASESPITDSPSENEYHALERNEKNKFEIQENKSQEILEIGDNVTIQKENQSKLTEKQILFLFFTALIVFGSFNRIFSKLLTIPMQNYPIVTNIVLCFIYCLFYGVYMLFNWKKIGPEEKGMSLKNFVIMGSLDSIGSIMQTFAFNYMPGALIILLLQSTIPVSMVVTKFWITKTEYKFYHYLGASVVVVGLAVALLPQFINPDGTDSGTTSNKMELIWAAVLIISCVPSAVSNVFKEKVLQKYKMNPMYMNSWMSVFQFGFTLVFCIPTIYAQNLSITELPRNFVDGLKCLAGYNSAVVGTSSSVDDCSLAPFYYFTYIAFNIIYNIIIVYILKHAGSNIFYLASTCLVPIVNIAYSLNFVPGHTPFTVFSIVGLLVIIFGLLFYRFFPLIYSYFTSTSDRTEYQVVPK